MKTIGIDASNLRQGGGVTHLVEILRAVEPSAHGIGRIVVWSNVRTLAALENRDWLVKVALPELEGGQIQRAFWQRFTLERLAHKAGCDLLFVPGGNYPGTFRPFVTMSRNMLPFDKTEMKRYGWSLSRLRLHLLRFLQGNSFRRADGVIFLTEFARREVQSITGPLLGNVVTIPHGVNHDSSFENRTYREITSCTPTAPFRLLYISDLSPYKHQWHVVTAVARLRAETGWSLFLDLVGPATHPETLTELNILLDHVDPSRTWVCYHGPRPRAELAGFQSAADAAIFASSCENMPNVLLEKMAAGLPLACSNCGPMPEILGDAGLYFDPENADSIKDALHKLIASPSLRKSFVHAAQLRVKTYSWDRCARETFDYLSHWS